MNKENKVQFEEGKTYEMRFIGDSDMRPHYKCINRTPKMATFESVKGKKEVIRRKIREYRNVERVHAGSYSMAPIISADNEVNQ